MRTIALNDGSQHVILSSKDLVDIAERLGSEFAEVVEELLDNQDANEFYAEKKLSTDLDCYEEELKAYQGLISDLTNELKIVSGYLSKVKVPNRNVILKHIRIMNEQIKEVVNNV